MSLRIAHLVNPVNVGPESDLHVAQPITFESLRRARGYSAGSIDVTLLSCSFPEDAVTAPPDFIAAANLERSVCDLGTSFRKPRRLPLLKDLLDRFYAATDADWLIYSNVDIAAVPYFYSSVAALIENGYDGLVINRRTIADKYSDLSQLELMYAEAGEPHPGHDCFVFHRRSYPQFDLGNVCLGINWVGRVLLWNLCVHAKRFHEFKDLHLTFHLGNDKVWKSDIYDDYRAFNEAEARKVFRNLETNHGQFTEDHPIQPYIPVGWRGGRMKEASKYALHGKGDGILRRWFRRHISND